MCGIGAVLRTDGEPIPESWLDALDARIAHRGPDGQGRFRDRVTIRSPDGPRAVEVALVHRRLSIIDPGGGAQPMVSESGPDGSGGLVAVVFNGCIYNHRELRAELTARGHRFTSDHSDTEVLLHGHREWGDDLRRRLEGMYAYALWDRAEATLVLARDAFGEKPLYHRLDRDGGEDGRLRLLVAASDAAAAAAVPGAACLDAPRRHAWAARYLRFGYARGGCALQPGGTAAAPVEPGGLPPEMRSEAADEAEIEALLEQAVARRLEADVPLGCFLSGGVDSSLIAHFAARHKAGLRTFCVRMPDPRYDESEHAEAVAAHLETDHATLDAAPRPAEDLVTLIRMLGQPFADSSILPTYWVSRAAREHVKVALSGDGGDELFLGYERYLAARPLAGWHRVLQAIPGALLRRPERSRLHKLGRLGEMAREFPHLGPLATEALFTTDQIEMLLGEPPPDENPAPAAGDAGDPLAALRGEDLAGYLPDDLLRKVDTASMAVALEVRCPYLDRDLAAAVLATPLRRLMPGRRRKGLLRRIARRHLPAGAVDREKMGFAVPIGRWFRTDYGGLRTLLLDHLHSAEPFGDIAADRVTLRRLIDEHMAGRQDHGHRLFALLTLSIWAKR